mgnify:CR=1 FL=1
MRWEWENKVSLQRLLQKLKDADSSGAVLTKAEAKFMYDQMKDCRLSTSTRQKGARRNDTV